MMDAEIYPLTYRLEQDYWWYRGRRAVILGQTAALLAPVAIRGRPRILDFGCGTGINLLHLAGLGDAFGMDASPQAIDFCRRRGLRQVAWSDPQRPPGEENPFGGPFDLLTLLDVLEHLPDDRQALRGLTSLLKPGGLLLVTVPAYRFLWSGEDVVSHHLRRYRGRELALVIRQAGFEIIKQRYFNFFLFPGQVATTLWGRWFVPDFMRRSTLKPLAPGVNQVLTKLFSAEAGLLGRIPFPWGGSLLCTARLGG